MDNRMFLVIIMLTFSFLLIWLSHKEKHDKTLYSICSIAFSFAAGIMLNFILMTWNQVPIK